MKKSILVLAAATALATTLSVSSASAQMEAWGNIHKDPQTWNSPWEGQSNPCVGLGFLNGTGQIVIGGLTRGPAGVVSGGINGFKAMTDCK